MKEQEHFREHGWCLVELRDPQLVWEARSFLEKELRNLLGAPCSLESYHESPLSEINHTEIQIALTRSYRDHQWGPRIIAAQLPFFRQLLGLDLLVQRSPYLRIARPGKKEDHIGYHRDTFYGGSPYELSIFLPFVDLPAESSLSVLSGSHIHPETRYPTVQMDNPDPAVRKGLPKHQLGFLYAPKVMDPSIEKMMQPIALKTGQALIFSLSTVHGSVLNGGAISRWSSDIRVMHAFAPVDLEGRPDYYVPLSLSIITQLAREYFAANEPSNELELCHSSSGV